MTKSNIPTENGYYWVRVSYSDNPDEVLILDVAFFHGIPYAVYAGEMVNPFDQLFRNEWKITEWKWGPKVEKPEGF